ncbi:MAG: ABC transporter substrate-binding protein [Acetobacteraceae bacterium]|nr:ABC transporter substrate-binding protein [Acetobacteraceae bacterium]MBV8524771.1 ABC transporter substrate-binding protein [Acetobacteraceae bacterium]MBV8590614.1 ABC transporter substrate-binding protein [Acetobacteraceae bacterium]
MRRRDLLKGSVAAGSCTLARGKRAAAETPGVTATEIEIGNTMPYSGPASTYAAVGRCDAAFWRMVNDNGGVAGRRINFISLDDGYSPPRTVEQARRLIEQDQVACLFNCLGTPTNTAIQRYCNQKKVPQLFVATGADKWGDYKHFPWTIGWQPSYRVEAGIYGRYILENKPDGRIGILYQNDDFGKDYVIGLRLGLGDKFEKMVVKAVSYEVSDPTIDSQVVTLKSAGANVLIAAAIPKPAAQLIRKLPELGWKPLFFMSNVSISAGSVIEPAGPEKAIGMISAGYLKDPADPRWNSDPGMQEWRGFMTKYMPGADLTDGLYVVAYGVSQTMLQTLRQCDGDFSRENIMKQATSLHDLEIPTLLPGIKVNTGPANYHPIRQMQLARWTGKHWEYFGRILESPS